MLRQVSEGVLSAAAGAARLKVTPRQFRRLRRRFEAEGDESVVHGLRGRRSNNALPAAVRERVLEVASGPTYRDFGPTLARERRAALGELCQWDSSVHAWLEDRGPGDLALISIHDDATSRLQTARLVERDNGAENRRAAIAYLRQHGRPLAFYADHAGHFGQWRTAKGRRTDTIIARGLDQLGVEMILASSPQAKGRVERSFGTAQDRLVKEMRVEGIAGLAEANRFLAERWVPFWNERFAVEPAVSGDAHRPLPREVDLEAVFAETEKRVVANDFTVRFRNRYWQAPRAEADGVSPGTRVVVERRLDGDVRFRVGEQSRWAASDLGRCPRRRSRAGPRTPCGPSATNWSAHPCDRRRLSDDGPTAT